MPTMVDDRIPITDSSYDTPFVMCPMLHNDGQKINKEGLYHKDYKKLREKCPEIDIWPQIIAKALSKAFLNYERMLMQNLRHFFRDLTGMPVRDYESSKIDFSLLRNCFKRQHMMIGRCNKSFKDFVKINCNTRNCDEDMMSYWTVNHPVVLDNGEKWVELTHPICLTFEPKGKPLS